MLFLLYVSDGEMWALSFSRVQFTGAETTPFSWDQNMGMAYASASGDFISEPGKARSYLSERGVKFIAGLTELLAMEPEGG